MSNGFQRAQLVTLTPQHMITDYLADVETSTQALAAARAELDQAHHRNFECQSQRDLENAESLRHAAGAEFVVALADGIFGEKLDAFEVSIHKLILPLLKYTDQHLGVFRGNDGYEAMLDAVTAFQEEPPTEETAEQYTARIIGRGTNVAISALKCQKLILAQAFPSS